MGRNSGSGSRGGLHPGDGNYKGKVTKVESLIKMKDRRFTKKRCKLSLAITLYWV